MSSPPSPDLQIRDITRDRYHALSISQAWDLRRIRTSNVLVVGAGALGNEVSKNLAMMGVQLLAVLDRDIVETANLSRSVFFRESDHGRPKVYALSERLKDLNPDVEVLPLAGDLDAVLGLGLVRRMDIVFSCLDSRLARRSINRMCEKVAKPWVDGGMEDLVGYVAAYIPGQGPCYECTLSNVEKAMIANVASCRQIAVRALALGKVSTTSTMGSIVSGVQVQEAVKILQADLETSLAGKRLVIDCKRDDFYVTEAGRKENCEGHYRFGEIRHVSEFSAERTSAADVLERFKEETGESGHLDLGRESWFVCRVSTVA
jgi:molybdopterin/thiamine biosynthesis adenylyltransferase